MIKSIINFLYRFLFLDENRNKMSHTKFWSNIGYACLCFTFVYAVMYGTTVDVMIWALFGIVVVGNRTVIHLFDRGASRGSSEINTEDPPKESL